MHALFPSHISFIAHREHTTPASFGSNCLPSTTRIHKKALRLLLSNSEKGASTSTISEVFLQNHASPSRPLTPRKPKSMASFLFPEAQPSAKPWVKLQNSSVTPT